MKTQEPMKAAVLATMAVISTILWVQPAAAQAVRTCDGKVATIVGTAGDDIITGTSGDDVIVSLQGDDSIFAGEGDDTICAGQGNDTVRGALGFDVIFGAQGDDLIFASNGDSDEGRTDTAGGRIFGGAGDDEIHGNNRWDRMQGGAGDDLLRGYEGRDWMRGGADRDDISGGLGIDDLHGGNGADRIAIQGADTVRGGNGVDTCILGGFPEALISCGRNRPEAAANEPQINFAAGEYQVRQEAPLGLYRTTRYFELNGADDSIVVNDFQIDDGPTVGIVDDRGTTIEFRQSAQRITSTTPALNPFNHQGGRFLVGLDIAPGTYRVNAIAGNDASAFTNDRFARFMDGGLSTAGSVTITIPVEAVFFDFRGTLERL